jgi:hypothetical protein
LHAGILVLADQIDRLGHRADKAPQWPASPLMTALQEIAKILRPAEANLEESPKLVEIAPGSAGDPSTLPELHLPQSLIAK